MSKKKQVTLRLNEDHVEKINEWRNSQSVPPSFAAAIDTAIAQFVDSLDDGGPTIARGIDVKGEDPDDRIAALERRVRDLEGRTEG